jgi:hypothetical protein
MRGTGVLGFLTVVAAVAAGWSETPTAPASGAAMPPCQVLLFLRLSVAVFAPRCLRAFDLVA